MQWNGPAAQKVALIFTGVVYLSGMIGMQTAWRDWFISMTPFSLLLSAALVVQHQPVHTTRTTAWALGAFLIGYFSEVIGVNTGLIFGDYAYGSALGPKIWETPLMIGVNWMVVTLIVNECIWRMVPARTPFWQGAAAAAAGCTLLDWWMEPGAIHLGYWTWDLGMPPAENYFGWFSVSLIISLAYPKLMTPGLRNAAAPALLALQVLFFGVIR